MKQVEYCGGDYSGGTCLSAIKSGYCIQNGKCYKDGDKNPRDECQVCVFVFCNCVLFS